MRPLLLESLDSENMVMMARVEEEQIAARENHNVRKSEVLEAAQEVRKTVLETIAAEKD